MADRTPVIAGIALDLVDHRLGLRLRATREDDVRALARELLRRDLADAGVRPGDDERLAFQILHGAPT